MTVDLQTAESDINRWLDYRNVKPAKRESRYKPFIQTLVDAVCDGSLRVDDNHNLVQTLSVPFQGEIVIKELVYKPRLRVDEVKIKVDQDDAFSMLTPYVAALTNQPLGLIRKMDTSDWDIARDIANFFM